MGYPTPKERAEAMLKESGYARGGAIEKKLITKAVHEHEEHDHPGHSKTKIKLRGGGKVKGKAHEEHRPDRRARGGKISPIKIVVNGKGDDPGKAQMAAQQGMRAGAALGARAMASKMGGAPAGGPPGGMPMRSPVAGPGGPPGMPPGAPGAGIKRGGEVKKRARGGKIEPGELGDDKDDVDEYEREKETPPGEFPRSKAMGEKRAKGGAVREEGEGLNADKEEADEYEAKRPDVPGEYKPGKEEQGAKRGGPIHKADRLHGGHVLVREHQRRRGGAAC